MTRNLSEAPRAGFRVPDAEEKSIDWAAERDRVDLAALVTRLLGPEARKRGGRLWWPCPLHEDNSPSFFVKAGMKYWRCYGCSAHGDAVDLVMRLERLDFPEAVAWILGEPLPSRVSRNRSAQAAPRPQPDPQPEGWREASLSAVEDAERRLWTPEGADAVDYLHGRGLTEATARAARLGVIRVGRTGVPAGVTISWFDGPRLTMVNVRRAPGSDPKYMTFAGSRRGGVYPGPTAVKPGVPLVIVEGEFDALLLGQELAGLASAITLGCAGDRADRRVLDAILPAPRWFAANDADAAGDKAAEPWIAYERCRRVRPPGPHKDWTEAAASGVNLRRWWGEILAGAEGPELYTWEELSTWRWGPATEDPTPGLIV